MLVILIQIQFWIRIVLSKTLYHNIAKCKLMNPIEIYCSVLHYSPGETPFRSSVYQLYSGMSIKTHVTWLEESFSAVLLCPEKGIFNLNCKSFGWISPWQSHTPGTNILHRSNLTHLGVTALNNWAVLISKSGALS